MRKLLCFAFVFLSAFAFGQTTAVVTGALVDQSETGTSSGISVDVTLVNTGSQRCFVNGVGTVATEKKNYTAAQILAGITLAKTANITCGASSGQSRWRFSFKNSALNTSRDCDLQISGATSLNTATCLQATTTPTTTVPTSSLYWLLDGSNSPTGNLVPAVNGTQSVGTSGSRWSVFASAMDNSGNATVGGTLGVTGNASFKGGSPWFDVTAFGAKCDAVTDDTAAIQAAWNAAKAVGSSAFVYFPPKTLDCIAAGTLNFSSSNGIRMGGLGGGTGSLSFPRITFTGSTGPLVNCQNSLALTFQNMAFTYTNAAFVSNVFDCTSAGTGNSIVWDNVAISGTSTAKTAANLILAPGCQKCGAYKSWFNYAVNGINSLTGNVFTVEDCDFASFGPISGSYLSNMTAGSRVTGNNFEFINAPNTSSIFDSSGAGCFGCDFSGNWSGDMPAGWTGTLFKGATGGMSIHGNTFQGVATATVLTINGGQNGLDFTGNSIQGPWGTIFTANAAVSNVNITGNQYSGAITNFWTGAGNIPTSGIVTDNSGNTTIYGGNLTMSASTFPRLILNAQGGAVDTKNWDILGTSTQLIFRHMNDALNSASNAFVVDNVGNVVSDVAVQVPFDLQEQGAPTARAGFSRLYGDSTSHTLKASLNGGSFFNIPQVIASGTASMTTAGITTGACGTTVTVAATGVVTTDPIDISHNAAVTIGNGGGLTLNSWPTAGNVNFNYCNSSAGTITPTAMTVNWSVRRP